MAQLEVDRARLIEALRYWLPDETMIPAGHERQWNDDMALLKELQ